MNRSQGMKLSRSSLAFLLPAGVEQSQWAAEREGSMSIREERRGEPRQELHRIWTVSVESDRFGHRRVQLLDHSPSGMRLALDGCSALQPGERLTIHYPGTNFRYVMKVQWTAIESSHTVIGARLMEGSLSLQQVA
jgi:hypothetical protein